MQPMIRRLPRVRAAGVEPERDAHRSPLEGRQNFHGGLALEAAANNEVVRSSWQTARTISGEYAIAVVVRAIRLRSHGSLGVRCEACRQGRR